MTASEISARLAEQAEYLCQNILPNGKHVGHEWCVGDVGGATGRSCKVCLDGPKRGVWSDFATGESGDLLDLVKATQCLTLPAAIKWSKRFLNLSDDAPVFRPGPSELKPIAQPDTNPIQGTDGFVWLGERGIGTQTMQAYGLSEKDGAIVFPYYRDDKLYMTKHRKPRTREIWTSKNSHPILWGWHAIEPDERAIVICEGEIDAMSYAEQGIPALSVPYGAGTGDKHKWIANDFNSLEWFDTIFLSMDMDDEGEKANQEIIDRLGRHRCRVVKLPRKDANECHMDGLRLIEFVDKAETRDPKELKPAQAFYSEVFKTFYPDNDALPGMPLPWFKTRDLFRCREGELTVWSGINGHGKTMVLNHVAVSGIGLGSKFCVFSGEMMPARLLHRLYRQAAGVDIPAEAYLAEINRWLTDKLFIFDVRGNAKTDNIIKVFEYARMRYGCTQFIVDSLAKCGIAEDDYRGQKAFVDALCDFCKEHACHVHLVAHTRKGESEHHAPNKMDVKGTGAITDMADNVLGVWRNKAKEDKVDQETREGGQPEEETLGKPCAVITCHKQRNFDWERKISLWFNLSSYQYLEQPDHRGYEYVQFGDQGYTDEF